MFLICLDDNEPVTTAERIRYGYLGDGFNRWHDKGQQYIVPRNGRSGQIVEHSLIDGVTTYRLNLIIQEAINKHQPVSESATNGTNGYSPIEIDEYKITTTPEIDEHIAALRLGFLAITDVKAHSHLTVPRLGKEMLLQHSVPIKASVDLAIQVASRLYFGHSPAAWEVISTSHFHRGRPDIVQVVQDSVLRFVDACVDPTVSNIERRALLLTAGKDSNAYLRHATEGKNYFRLMDVLELMGPQKGEVGRPALFSDPVWKRVEPGVHIMMTMDVGLMSESAYNMFGIDSVWTNYTVWDDRFTMNCVMPKARLGEWEAAMQKAAEIVAQVVEAR